MTSAISIEGLQFSYGSPDAPLIRDLTLDLEKGSVTAILGPNGAGKTTLLHLLLGVYAPDKGRVTYFEKPASQYPPSRFKQMIGLVSQNESIPFDMTVLEYVLLGRAPHKKMLEIPDEQDRQTAYQALETTGIQKMADWGITRLSSGEAQLAAVARMLAQAPAIQLLDEPSSHLDLINTRRILNLIRQQGDDGNTVIFTTHHPNAAAAVADRILLFRNGEKIALGTPKEMMAEQLLTQTYGDVVRVFQTPAGPVVTAI